MIHKGRSQRLRCSHDPVALSYRRYINPVLSTTSFLQAKSLKYSEFQLRNKDGSMKFHWASLTRSITYRQQHGQWNLDISPLHQIDWQVRIEESLTASFHSDCGAEPMGCCLMRTGFRSAETRTTDVNGELVCSADIWIHVWICKFMHKFTNNH